VIDLGVPDKCAKEVLPTVLASLGELKFEVCTGGPGYDIGAAGATGAMGVSLTGIIGFVGIPGAGRLLSRTSRSS
jgi:hypothetical protein